MNNKSSLASAESIKARLKNEADINKKNFDFLLLHYFIERLLFRLSISSYANNFILKGGLLLYTVLNERGRATKDIDFLAKNVSNTHSELVRIFTEIASIPVNDAVSFDTKNIIVESIKEDADYQGIRIKLTAYLDKSRRVLQFDIGFDDVIIPHQIEMLYPTLLDMEPPRLKAYSLESVIAEKFQAIVYLADLNSRIKDYYDIFELSCHCDFKGTYLCDAIAQAFKNRKTDFNPYPVVFRDDFSLLTEKQIQWQAFLNRTGIINTTNDFSVIIAGIKKFLLPVYEALVNKSTFFGQWDKESKTWDFINK